MLQKLLELKDIGDNCFRSTAHQKNFRNALFGGQALAQALMAAGRTTKGIPPHSLHAYFLRPGKADTDITYHVEILRDGRSVSTRYVKAIQDGKVIFTMQASFHKAEHGYSHQASPPNHRIEPELLKSQYSDTAKTHLQTHLDGIGIFPIDFIPFNLDIFEEKTSEETTAQFWVKSVQDLPDDPLMHYCALAFASDIGLLGSSLLAHDNSIFSGKIIPASMDHALWFHGQPNFNQWHRYVVESPWAGGARTFCNGNIFNYDDQHTASACQEGIIRLL